MLFWFELFGVLLLSGIVFSQIIVPLWRNVPLFPFFRSTGDLHGKLREVHGLKEDAELEEIIDRTLAELKKHGCEVSHDLSEIRCGHANHDKGDDDNESTK